MTRSPVGHLASCSSTDGLSRFSAAASFSSAGSPAIVAPRPVSWRSLLSRLIHRCHRLGAVFARLAKVLRTRTSRLRGLLRRSPRRDSVDLLASAVAHEIRNPLTSMRMWMHLIRESVAADDALCRRCTMVEEEIARLEQLAGNVLQVAGTAPTELRPHDITTVVQRTLAFMEPWLHAMKVRVVQDHAAGLPQAQADEIQLRQLLTNLVVNATEAGGTETEIRVTTSAETEQDRQRTVVLRVQDSGPGIAEGMIDDMFRPFATTKSTGTGLGLWIVSRIVARHSGHIAVESSTSQGTTIAVRIPAAEADSSGQDPRSR